MKLASVLEGVKLASGLSTEAAGAEVAGLDYDSRRIGKDFLFFAFPGSRVDGREFVQDALARGACAMVSELPPPENFHGTWIEVEHGRRALAVAARNFYQRPDERVGFTGITGTNGKTTTSYLIDSILEEAGFATALIGTIEHRLLGNPIHSANTTPESLDVMRLAADLDRRGGPGVPKALTMEVSSHALALGRVYGIRFHTAVFTNLTRDHLDFHHTMEEYGAAKRLLFQPDDSPAPEWEVLNADDPASGSMAGGSPHTLWYGLSGDAQIGAENISAGFDGLRFDLRYEGALQPVESALLGRFNLLNILAAAGAGVSYGLDLATIARGIAKCRAVPGRFERVEAGQPFLVIVDYAHTDDALRNAIQAARELASSQKARVITLFGCGGDRDRTKRPLMGVAAAELSDFVVLTSDNPRSEDPLDIINDALVGLRRPAGRHGFDTPYLAEPDRGKAIHRAIEQARPGDVVLLAGKGHENYQVLKDRTIDFDDRETAREALRSLGYEAKEPEDRSQKPE